MPSKRLLAAAVSGACEALSTAIDIAAGSSRPAPSLRASSAIQALAEQHQPDQRLGVRAALDHRVELGEWALAHLQVLPLVGCRLHPLEACRLEDVHLLVREAGTRVEALQ